MAKKIFYISFFFLVLTLIILVAYNFVFKNNNASPTAGEQAASDFLKETSVDVPAGETALSGKIDSPLNDEVLGAVTGPGGNLYYYSLTEQALKKSTFEGKNKETLLTNLPGSPERIIWSPKRDWVLLGLSQGGRLRWYSLHVATKTLTPLKPEVGRATWSQTGERIFYQFTDSKGERFLDSARPDGSDFKTVTALGRIDHFIATIPQSSDVSLWTRPTGLETTIFETLRDTGTERKVIFDKRYGGDYSWAPNGQKVAVSMLDERGTASINLSLINKNGGELQRLGIPTFVSKIAWGKDSKTLYYALPGNLPGESVLPNDYYQKPLYSEDTFWRIDTETGQKTRLLELDKSMGGFDSADLFLSSQEDYLFFTDRKTKKLYRIEL